MLNLSWLPSIFNAINFISKVCRYSIHPRKPNFWSLHFVTYMETFINVSTFKMKNLLQEALNFYVNSRGENVTVANDPWKCRYCIKNRVKSRPTLWWKLFAGTSIKFMCGEHKFFYRPKKRGNGFFAQFLTQKSFCQPWKRWQDMKQWETLQCTAKSANQ